jgi:Flp pilus assembly pilin Flp
MQKNPSGQGFVEYALILILVVVVVFVIVALLGPYISNALQSLPFFK